MFQRQRHQFGIERQLLRICLEDFEPQRMMSIKLDCYEGCILSYRTFQK